MYRDCVTQIGIRFIKFEPNRKRDARHVAAQKKTQREKKRQQLPYLTKMNANKCGTKEIYRNRLIVICLLHNSI